MGKVAFLFSGQGAQHPGMGMGFYEACPAVRQLFDEAQRDFPGILELMANGSAEELKRTVHTQPATYLADVAAALYFQSQGLQPDGLAGFSLGELAALAIGGAYTPAEGFRLVLERARAMDAACQANPSGMLAVLRLPTQQVEALCAQVPGTYPANYNCEGQVSVSGTKEALEELAALVKAQKGRSLMLQVSGGFHAPFMDSAAAEFSRTLEQFPFARPSLPVYANRTAAPYEGAVAPMLAEQINHSVRWAETLSNLWEQGYTIFIETGVGTVLKNLVPKVLPQAQAYAAETPAMADAVLAALKEEQS